MAKKTIRSKVADPSHSLLRESLDALPARILKDYLRSRGIGIPKTKPEMIALLCDHLKDHGATATVSLA